jgi:Baseplate J-like protein.
VVTVDNGTGAPPASLLATIAAVVNAVRPVGTRFAVQGPVVVVANVSLTLSLATGAQSAAAIAAVTNAIASYIEALPVGASLPYSRLVQLAYDASAAVVNVTDLTLNGAAADIVPPIFGVVRTGTISVG